MQLSNIYDVGPPSFKIVCKPPLTIVIGTINHSCWSFARQLTVAIVNGGPTMFLVVVDHRLSMNWNTADSSNDPNNHRDISRIGFYILIYPLVIYGYLT